MKKLLSLLFLLTIFVSCSSDDDNDKIDNNKTMTKEQLIGEYVLKGFIDDKGNSDPISLREKNTIEFRADNTGDRYSLKDEKLIPFTWQIVNGKARFTIDLLGDCESYFEDGTLVLRGKSEYSGNIGTYKYK